MGEHQWGSLTKVKQLDFKRKENRFGKADLATKYCNVEGSSSDAKQFTNFFPDHPMANIQSYSMSIENSQFSPGC